MGNAVVVALKPRRQYSFTGNTVDNPAAPPPGDRLDSEIDRIDAAIAQLIEWVAVSLNPDGTLKPGAEPMSAPTRPPLAGPFSMAGADPAALAMDWAEVSFEWAEHMPDTIPPNILATMGITGDHWSARWWAHRALTIAQLLVDGNLPPPSPPLDLTGSITLPPGAAGDVNIRNGTGAAITITLPAGPVPGQTLKFKDALGNAGTYPITIGGASIDGNPSYVLMSNYMSLELFWMGAQWGTR